MGIDKMQVLFDGSFCQVETPGYQAKATRSIGEALKINADNLQMGRIGVRARN